LTMDLHADQIQGFFDIPVDNIYASPVLLSDLKSKAYPDLVVVSPDVGGVVRARALAKQLGSELAIIDKRRPKANVSEVMHVIGEIDGRNCVIMDDMIDTAGTLVKAAEVLKERGAPEILQRIDCVVVQASYASPLLDVAQVVLPAAIWAEKSGTVTNFEGRVSALRPVLPPAGDAREDAAILESVFA